MFVIDYLLSIVSDDLFPYRTYSPSLRCNRYGWFILSFIQKEVEDQKCKWQSTDDVQDIVYTVIMDEEVTYHIMVILHIPLMFVGSGASAPRRLDLLDLYDPDSLPFGHKVLGQDCHVGVTILCCFFTRRNAFHAFLSWYSTYSNSHMPESSIDNRACNLFNLADVCVRDLYMCKRSFWYVTIRPEVSSKGDYS